ncbi:MAG TPA: response regulator transcription factor [Acidobacteriaceae bacterium]|nr:response regulator transcription factor [Acidobacteriaceae bacterium]
MTIRAVIVDDEQLARQELEYLLRKADDVEIVAQGNNGVEAVELVRAHQPDVVFLDVQMPGLDGFAVLKKLLDKGRKSPLPNIVFATAFDRYAVRAFEVNAVDYLLKPFDEKRVRHTLERVRTRLAEVAAGSLPATVASTRSSGMKDPPVEIAPAAQAVDERLDALVRLLEQQQAPAKNTAAKIVLRVGGRLLLVEQRDICFASIEEGTISVATHSIEGQSNCRTLEDLLELLDPELFWRAHRSFVVNIHRIQEVVPWFKSSYQLRMDDRRHSEIPVSRGQTKRLRELFNL